MKKFLFALLLTLPVVALSQVLPTVTTGAITNNTVGIAQAGLRVTCSGNVTNIGTSALTARGFVWSDISTTPTINAFSSSRRDSARLTFSGGAVGTFTGTIAPLFPNRTYYIRAYATNGSGTTYGNTVTFTTVAARAPSKFYFSSSTGNNNNAGTITAPWQTLSKLQDLVTSGNVTFVPGDSIFFKRGDVFFSVGTNDSRSDFATYWVRNPVGGYFTAPSGLPGSPIVITNYGDSNLPLPNILRPETIPPVSYWPNDRPSVTTLQFSGVSDMVIDGLQSDDYRMQAYDKITPGYTGGFIIGEYTQSSSSLGLIGSNNPNNRIYFVRNFVVRNCRWNNTTYGLKSVAAMNTEIAYNTVTNLKSGSDTAGTNDVMAGGFEAFNGFNLNVHHNYIKGAWAKSGRISSTDGLGGVGIDIFNLKNSRIAYNTFIDCSGMFEVGNLDEVDTTSGAQSDTFAFNKIINCGNVGYLHSVSGAFVGSNYRLALWNNVIVSNNKDRQNGPGFGADIYGDNQGFRPGTFQPWWMCRNPLSTWNVDPVSKPVTTTAGSNIISLIYSVTNSQTGVTTTTVGNTTGISVGSVVFVNNDSILGRDYQTVTVTAINNTVSPPELTLSVPATQTKQYASSQGNEASGFQFYLPVSDQSWSTPLNSAYANWGGSRAFMQYSSDATRYGANIDTMIDSRNNIMYWTTGTQGVYDRNRFKRSNNIYSPRGGARYATSLGGTLNFSGTGEQQVTNTSVFVDTTAVYPENWDLRLATSLRANAVGAPTPGFNRDFDGNLYTTPFIGLYSYTSTTTLAITATATTILCNGGSSTVTVSATGGTPPYNGTGTFSKTAGTYTFSVVDATGASATTNVTIPQPLALTATAVATPITTIGGTSTITVTASGGTPTYQYRIGTGNYQVGNTFSGITAGTYTMTVRDANLCTATTTVTVTQVVGNRKFHVSASGNDANDGLTPNTAWKTLTKVQAVFNTSGIVAGDTISFRSGDTFTGTLTIGATGTAAYQITINSYGTGNKPKFTGTGTTIYQLFNAYQKNYIVFDNLEITDPTINDTAKSVLSKIQHGIVIDSGFNCTVRNCSISLVGTGVYLRKGGMHKVDNNTIYNLRMIVSDASPNNDSGAVAIKIAAMKDTITNNTIYGCWARSTDFTFDGGAFQFVNAGSLVDTNFIAYNTAYDNNGVIETFGTCRNNTLVYNKLVDNYAGVYFRDVISGWTFYNNTIIETATTRNVSSNYFRGALSATYGATITNNVFQFSSGIDVADTTRMSPFPHTNNLYKLSGSSVAGFTLTATEIATSARIFVDTANANPALWNLAPSANSALINAGTNLGFTRDFAGRLVTGTPDIGVLEFQASTIPLIATATAGTIACFGGTTTVTVTATGGTSPYTGTGTYIVSAGSYSIVVTDAIGATYTVAGGVTQPQPLTASASYPAIACNGGQTTIAVTAAGGTAPYTGTGNYTVSAGPYSYTVTDANGCTATTSVSVTQPIAVSVGVTTGTITVFGGTTTVTASAAGGTGTYQYSLDGGAYQTNNTFTGVLAGPHTMTARDQLGCTSTISFTLSQPGPAGNRSRLKFVNQ